jgi:hypothetical protein
LVYKFLLLILLPQNPGATSPQRAMKYLATQDKMSNEQGAISNGRFGCRDICFWFDLAPGEIVFVRF